MGVLKWLGIGKDVKEASDGIGGAVTNIIAAAKGQLTPEVKGEILKLQIETEAKIQEIMEKAQAAHQEFMLKYEGEATQIPPWLRVWRGVIRPFVTSLTFVFLFLVLGVDLYHFLLRVPGYHLLIIQLPSGFWWLLGIVATFWFGGRAGEHLWEKIGAKTNGNGKDQ